MTPVGFEPTLPVLEWVNTVHAIDGEATVIGTQITHLPINIREQEK
jgi:hypothetical protein